MSLDVIELNKIEQTVFIELVSITKETIQIEANLSKTTPRKTRYYIYQCDKTDEDDLGTIQVKKNKKSGQATIDLEDIDDMSFEIALYTQHNHTNPISNKLEFTVKNHQLIQIDNVDDTQEYSEDDDEYKNMYPVNLCEDVTEHEKKQKEEKQETLTLEVYGITCDESSCGKRFDPEDIFICTNVNCIKDDCNVYCRECGAWKHRRKQHSFDPKEKWIKCMTDFLAPNENEYSKARAKAQILVEVHAVEKFLWHHKWSLGVVSKSLSSASVTISSIAVNGHMTIAAACGLGHSVIANGLVAGAVGGGVGAAVSTVLESGFIWYKYGKGQLSLREAMELTTVSLVSNGVSAAAFFGVMAIGAAFGAPGGPIGVAVGVTAGAIIAAILFGFGTRYFLNKKLKKKYQHKHEAEIKLQKEALKYFFGKEKYPIDDVTKFNEKILRKKYHRLCLAVHPDKNDGKQNQEWLKLCAYYGILIGIWEKKHNKEKKITKDQDMNQEQRALVVKSALKCQIYQSQNNNENTLLPLYYKSNSSKVNRIKDADCKLKNLILKPPSDFMDDYAVYSVEEIVRAYDTLKIKFHFEASRLIKRSLKQNEKDLSKTKYLKIASKILFDILCESHKSIHAQNLEKLNMDDESVKEIAQNIVLECTKMQNVLLQKDAMNKVSLYSIECLKMCLKIVMSRNPPLTLLPLIFEPKATIIFDDAIYEDGPRSETIENLNFVIWPSIVRTDTNHHLRKIIAVFLNDIPLWSKAKLKRIEQERIVHNEEEKRETDQLNFKAKAKKIMDEAMSEFPAVYDIVTGYDILKTEYYTNASIAIKKCVKKRKKNLSKIKYLQIASKVLFDILCKSYELIEIWKNERSKKLVQKTVLNRYNIMLKKIEKAANKILDECITNKELNGMLSKEKDKILLYSRECLKICCQIVLSFNPPLKIEPLTFEPQGKIMFDDNIYEEGPRSEVNECLNFIMWPSLILIDTNERLSKTIGVFLNKIPEWSVKRKK